MKIISSISGGLSSAVCTQRAIDRYGKENVICWFADTNWEDEDLYRFKDECLEKWGCEYIEYKDGRNPLEVSHDEHVIPNNSLAPCTFRLKIDPFKKFILDYPKPVTVVLGLGWEEQHRMVNPKKRYEEIEGVTVEFPLMWKPLEFLPYYQVVKNWGIEPPRLYKMGFGHNNCGGRCVKQGQSDWKRLKLNFPERFEGCKEWENSMRENETNANYAFLKVVRNGERFPLPLEEAEKMWNDKEENKPNELEDMFGCYCGF